MGEEFKYTPENKDETQKNTERLAGETNENDRKLSCWLTGRIVGKIYSPDTRTTIVKFDAFEGSPQLYQGVRYHGDNAKIFYIELSTEEYDDLNNEPEKKGIIRHIVGSHQSKDKNPVEIWYTKAAEEAKSTPETKTLS